jgi:hypothetical protein
MKAFIYSWSYADEHQERVVLADTRKEADDIAREELLCSTCKDIFDQFDKVVEKPLERGVLL